jgi:hypothetical protein
VIGGAVGAPPQLLMIRQLSTEQVSFVAGFQSFWMVLSKEFLDVFCGFFI